MSIPVKDSPAIVWSLRGASVAYSFLLADLLCLGCSCSEAAERGGLDLFPLDSSEPDLRVDREIILRLGVLLSSRPRAALSVLLYLQTIERTLIIEINYKWLISN